MSRTGLDARQRAFQSLLGPPEQRLFALGLTWGYWDGLAEEPDFGVASKDVQYGKYCFDAGGSEVGSKIFAQTRGLVMVDS